MNDVSINMKGLGEEDRIKMLEPMLKEAAESFKDGKDGKYSIIAYGDKESGKVCAQFSGNNEDLTKLSVIILKSVVERTINNRNEAAAQILLITSDLMEMFPEIKKIGLSKAHKLDRMVKIIALELLEQAKKETENEN